ncbi:MAG: hypothetical protein JW395_3003 [Nitrospira sp.]|nr:hypothetical protein [Nitrospira sp.]
MAQRRQAETRYYLLVAGDTDKSRLSMPSAYEVATYRLKRREWGLKETTRGRRLIKAGDMILIYASGAREHGKHFVAVAEVETEARLIPRSLVKAVDAPNDAGVVLSPYSISLKNCRIFPEPVGICPIKHKLACIKDPTSKKWGCVLQNGGLQITKKDFDLVLKLAGI